MKEYLLVINLTLKSCLQFIFLYCDDLHYHDYSSAFRIASKTLTVKSLTVIEYHLLVRGSVPTLINVGNERSFSIS